jgi:hypothetical protein
MGMKKIYLEWEDITSWQEWIEDYEEYKPDLVKTVAWLVKKTKKYIYISRSISENKLENNAYMGLTVIPRGCIIIYKEIK